MLSSRICSSPKTRPLAWKHPSGRHLVPPGARASRLLVGCLKAGFSHRSHTTPFHASSKTQVYDIASFPAISSSLFAFTLVLEIRSFLHSGQVVAESLQQSAAAQKPRTKRPYDLRDLPSLPSFPENSIRPPVACFVVFISCWVVSPCSRITIVSPGPLLSPASHRTGAHAPDQESRLTEAILSLYHRECLTMIMINPFHHFTPHLSPTCHPPSCVPTSYEQADRLAASQIPPHAHRHPHLDPVPFASNATKPPHFPLPLQHPSTRPRYPHAQSASRNQTRLR